MCVNGGGGGVEELCMWVCEGVRESLLVDGVEGAGTIACGGEAEDEGVAGLGKVFPIFGVRCVCLKWLDAVV